MRNLILLLIEREKKQKQTKESPSKTFYPHPLINIPKSHLCKSIYCTYDVTQPPQLHVLFRVEVVNILSHRLGITWKANKVSKPRKSKSGWQHGTPRIPNVTVHVSREEFSLEHLAETASLPRVRSSLPRGVSIIPGDVRSSTFCNRQRSVFFNTGQAAGNQGYENMEKFSDI